MNTEPVTVSPDTPTVEAIRIMREQRLACLPVTEISPAELMDPAAAAAGGLGCAGGLGSAMTVTASFGLHAAAHVLGRLADAPPRADGGDAGPA